LASRDLRVPCIILRSRDSGAGHRLVSLMTPELGLLEAFMYGGGKSKLRSLASPYHAGMAWLYHDPVRDSYKLSDFDPVSAHEGARASLGASLHASLWAELLIRVRGGGVDFQGPFRILDACLSGLDALPEAEAVYASLVFIWGLAGCMGLRPDPAACMACPGALGWDGVECYSSAEGGFLCRVCAAEAGREGLQTVPAGAGRYLLGISRLDAAGALRLRMDLISLNAAKRLAWSLARRLAEGELNTLSMGEGIL